MKFVFMAKRVQGDLCVVAIRRLSSGTWFHFRRRDWAIKNHNPFVQDRVRAAHFALHRQIEINLAEPVDVLQYFDALREIAKGS